MSSHSMLISGSSRLKWTDAFLYLGLFMQSAVWETVSPNAQLNLIYLIIRRVGTWSNVSVWVILTRFQSHCFYSDMTSKIWKLFFNQIRSIILLFINFYFYPVCTFMNSFIVVVGLYIGFTCYHECSFCLSIEERELGILTPLN